MNKREQLKSGRKRLKTGGFIVFIIILAIAAVRYFQSENVQTGDFDEADSPIIRYPCTQEYEAGTGNIKGNVDAKSFASISDCFAIGANEDGYAVFKDPAAAFEEMEQRYAEGIKRTKQEFDLQSLSKINYISYKNLGCQVTTGTEEEQKQAAFVSEFLEIYENSYKNPGAYLWAVVDESSQTGVSAYVISEMPVSIRLDNCEEELAAYDIVEVRYEINAETSLADFISVEKLSEEQIEELAASKWEYEETDGDGTYYMYAIVAERIDNTAIVCGLKNSDSGQRIQISEAVLAQRWEADANENPEPGSIICINYNTGAEYDEEEDEISLSEIRSINKLY